MRRGRGGRPDAYLKIGLRHPEQGEGASTWNREAAGRRPRADASAPSDAIAAVCTTPAACLWRDHRPGYIKKLPENDAVVRPR